MKHRRIYYLIDQSGRGDGTPPIRVTGIAIELPEPWRWFRVCVRKISDRNYRVDHFDTGKAVTIVGVEPKTTIAGICEEAADMTVLVMQHRLYPSRLARWKKGDFS